MIKSVINGKKITKQFKGTGIRIDSEQIVMAALEVMLANKEFSLPVYEAGRCVGVVYFKDLILFLALDLERSDLFTHKLNYTLESAITILMRLNDQEAV